MRYTEFCQKQKVAKLFFGAIPGSLFISCLDKMIARKSFGINEAVCLFAEDADPDDGFDAGVFLCWLGNESVLSDEEFQSALYSACLDLCRCHPEMKKVIEKKLGSDLVL